MMKRLILIYILLVQICFCEIHSQAVDYDSILINGQFPRQVTITFLKRSGIIDSIIPNTPLDSFSQLSIWEHDSLVYIGASCFEYYSKRGICRAQIIIFDKINYLTIGGFRIDKMTTSKDLESYFPKSCCDLQPINLGKSKIRQTCRIPIMNNGRIWDMHLRIFLNNDKVFRIDYWEPM